MESADFFRQILFQPRLLRIRVRKTSPVKSNNFHPIHLPNLHIQVSDSIGLHLDMQTRPLVHALYPVSVRQTGTLPPASFGFPSRWTPLPLANDSHYQGSFGTYTL